jgi:hypothetical protein
VDGSWMAAVDADACCVGLFTSPGVPRGPTVATEVKQRLRYSKDSDTCT